jgi:peptide chain release factor subunit 1
MGELKQNADAILARYERDLDVQLVGEALEKAAAGTNIAVLGVAGCLWAGTVKAVDKLLVQDDALVAGVVCGNCGWLGLFGDTCLLCEHPTRHAEDILDELAQAVLDESGTVRHIKADTDIKEHQAAATLLLPATAYAVGRAGAVLTSVVVPVSAAVASHSARAVSGFLAVREDLRTTG